MNSCLGMLESMVPKVNWLLLSLGRVGEGGVRRVTDTMQLSYGGTRSGLLLLLPATMELSNIIGVR